MESISKNLISSFATKKFIESPEGNVTNRDHNFNVFLQQVETSNNQDKLISDLSHALQFTALNQKRSANKIEKIIGDYKLRVAAMQENQSKKQALSILQVLETQSANGFRDYPQT